MSVRRLHHIPLLCLLIISLLISPAVMSGYVWCVTEDGHGFLEEAIAGDCAAGNHGEAAANIASAALSSEDDDGCGPCLDISTSHHWGNSRSRQDELQVSLLVGVAPTTVVAPVLLPDRDLNNHRVVETSPRIPDPLLHHRTTVLLI
jgi:hypothetical protein